MSQKTSTVIALDPALQEGGGLEHRLGSGHTVRVVGEDDVHITDPAGRLAVRITLSAEGPVVELAGATLKLETPGELALKCQRLTVDAEQDVALRAGGEMDLRSTGELTMHSDEDLKATAECIWLN